MKYPVKDELKSNIEERLRELGHNISILINNLIRDRIEVNETSKTFDKYIQRTLSYILHDIELYDRKESEQDG